MVSIALLTTGDEVIEGNILNSNAQQISKALTDGGYTINTHHSCRDNEKTIETAIKQLLLTHDAIITTGGLGPTADDRTRFALANYLDRALSFYEPTWQWIVDRYQRLKQSLPETNWQQAFFPEGAKVISNRFGSADGAFVDATQGFIFMLPGPPRECLPMIEEVVLPTLASKFSDKHRPLLKWRVFGISESGLAQKMNEAFGDFAQNIGYRWHYPYIDVKYRALSLDDEISVKLMVDEFLSSLIVCPETTTASGLLLEKLKASNQHFSFDDQITAGRLQQLLLTPKTVAMLNFKGAMPQKSNDVLVRLYGLEAYWLEKGDPNQMSISIDCITQLGATTTVVKLDYEPIEVLTFITELISSKLLNLLEV